MKKNYHTHTFLCKHAIGDIEEYIKVAIDEGFEVLGFSDHTPWPYTSSFRPKMRMDEEEFPLYFYSLLDYKEKYKNHIDIKIGLEVEYFPSKMFYIENLIKKYSIDYLILGQHYHETDEFEDYYGYPKQSIDRVQMYVNEVIKALETGYFSYVAHPDVIMYDKNDLKSLQLLEKICIKAKELDIPLEFNMLGYVTKRHYPSLEFIDLCRKHHNKIILGVDAHDPKSLRCQSIANEITHRLKKEGLEIVDEIKYLKREQDENL